MFSSPDIQNPQICFQVLSSLSALVSEGFKKLGQSAAEYTGQVNHKGDKVLVGDWFCEEATIRFFKEKGFPCVISTEEHGIVDLTNGRRSLFTVVIDGMDGSKYAQEDLKSEKYGTAIGILAGEKPRLSDSLGTLFIKHGQDKHQILVNSDLLSGWSASTSLKSYMQIDRPVEKRYPELLQAIAAEFPNLSFEPSGFAIANIIEGKSPAFIRLASNGILEIAAFAHALKISGAVAMTLSGQDLLEQVYNPFLNTAEVVVIACSRQVANETIARISKLMRSDTFQ